MSKTEIVDIQNTAHPTANPWFIPGKFIYVPSLTENMRDHRRHQEFLRYVSHMLQLPKWLGCFCHEDKNKCGKPNKPHTPDIAVLHHPSPCSTSSDIPVLCAKSSDQKVYLKMVTDFDIVINRLQMLSFMQTAYVLEVKHA